MIVVLLITQLVIGHINSHGVALFDPYHGFIAAILFASFITYFLIYISHSSFLRDQHIVLGFIDDGIRLDNPHIAVKRSPLSILMSYVWMNFLIIISVIIFLIVHIGLLGTDDRSIHLVKSVGFGCCFLVNTFITLNIRTNIFLVFTVMSIMSSLGNLVSAYLTMVTYAVLLSTRSSHEAVKASTVDTETSAVSLVSLSTNNDLDENSTSQTPPTPRKTRFGAFNSNSNSKFWCYLQFIVGASVFMTAIACTVLLIWLLTLPSVYFILPYAAYCIFYSVQIIFFLFYSSAERAIVSVSVNDDLTSERPSSTRCAIFCSLYALYLYVISTSFVVAVAEFVLFLIYWRYVSNFSLFGGGISLYADTRSVFTILHFIRVSQVTHCLIYSRHLSLTSEQDVMVGFISDDANADVTFESGDPSVTETSDLNRLVRGVGDHFGLPLIVLLLSGVLIAADIQIALMEWSEAKSNALAYIPLIFFIAAFLFYSKKIFNIRTNIALWLFVWYSSLTYILSLGPGDYGILLMNILLISVLYLATNFEVVGNGPKKGFLTLVVPSDRCDLEKNQTRSSSSTEAGESHQTTYGAYSLLHTR